MADNDNIPPVPLPPDDLNAAPAVPPVEAAPAVPSSTPAAPSAPDAGASAASVTPDASTPPAPPAYGPPAAVPPAYGQQPAYGQPVPPAYGQQPGAQPPYGSPTAYGQPAYVAQPAGPATGLSVTSMVLGIVGIVASFLWLGFLPAVAAVITGHLARKRQPWARGMWLTGLITGYIGVGIAVITLIGFIGIWIFAASTSSYY